MKATVYMFFKKKKKKRKRGKKSPKVRAFLCTSCPARGVEVRPAGEPSSVPPGSDSLWQGASGSSWGFALPWGAGTVTASLARSCRARPPFRQRAGPSWALRDGSGAIWQLGQGGLGLSLGDGDERVCVCGGCRDTARHPPVRSLVLSQLGDPPAVPSMVGLSWDLPQHSIAARSRVAGSCGPFNPPGW